MAQPKRNDVSYESSAAAAQPARPSVPWAQTPEGPDYRLGGQVGQMHMDLARRLAIGVSEESVVDSPEERIIRFLSVAGGFTAILAGYAGLIFLFLR